VENDLQIKSGAADDFEHVGRSRLLLQGFTQFVEQPRILDVDDGLGGEVLHQFDLLVGERSDFLAVDGDRSDQLIFSQHRHDEKSASARKFHQRNHTRVTINKSLLCSEVGYVNYLFCVSTTDQP